MAIYKIGRYEIKAELGRGGMGTVYRAYDPRFRRDVALKMLPRQFVHDPTFRARFEREAQVIASLEHPAIVPVYDFGEQDDQLYLVMRFMPGGSLAEQLKHGPLSIAEAARILTHLAPALDEVHAKGIIHRDLKPGNILFDQHNNPYVSDFGIAKLSQSSAHLTGSGIIGTPAYMSPEQVHGDKALDGRSDIYALGIILFEIVTARRPYDANTPAKLMMKHVLDPVPNVLTVKADLPRGCRTVIAKAMAKKPDARFPTARAMASALQEVVDRENISSSQKRLVIPSPILAASLLLIALLLVVAAFALQPSDEAVDVTVVGIASTPSAIANPQNTATAAVPATETPVPATETSVPATETAVPATETAILATETPVLVILTPTASATTEPSPIPTSLGTSTPVSTFTPVSSDAPVLEPSQTIPQSPTAPAQNPVPTNTPFIPTNTPIVPSATFVSPTPVPRNVIVTLLSPAPDDFQKTDTVRFRVQVSGKLDSDRLLLRTGVDQQVAFDEGSLVWNSESSDVYFADMSYQPNNLGFGIKYYWTVVVIGADGKVYDSFEVRRFQWDDPNSGNGGGDTGGDQGGDRSD